MHRLSAFVAVPFLLTPLAIAQGEAEPMPAAHDKSVWHADFDAAAAEAKKTGKDLLVDFTGSDWCGWCIRLDEEVFAHDEFLEPVTKKFVLVALDFPKSPEIQAKVPNPSRNEELQRKFGVQGFPTILLVTPDEEVFGRTGYQPGGPAPYLSHLEEMAGKGKAALTEIRALLEKIPSAEGDALVGLIRRGSDLLGELEGVESPKLVEFVRSGLAIDADNAKGLKKICVESLLSSGNVDDATIAAGKALDPKNESGLFERVVAAVCGRVASKDDLQGAVDEVQALHAFGVKDTKVGVELYTNAAFWCERFLENHEQAVVFAKAAKKLDDPNSPMNPQAKQMLDSILGQDG